MTTIPISGGRNRTGRVKTSPKRDAASRRYGFKYWKCGERFYAEGQDFRTSRGAAGKRCGSIGRRAGESLIRVGAVGIRIWKTPPRFPNSWAGGQTFPRTHGFQTRNQATTPTRATFPPSRFQAYAPFPPSLDKTTLPRPAICPTYDHKSHLGRAQPHREGQNVTK